MKIQFNLSELRNDFDTTLSVIDQLSNSQLHSNNRINNLETNIISKIDRSECDHLESLVAKVMLYDSFKANSIATLERLEKIQVSTINQHNIYDNEINNIYQQLQQAMYEITQSSTKYDTNHLKKQLSQHDDLIKDLASKTFVESLQQQIQSITIKCLNNISEINKLDQRLTIVDDELIKKTPLVLLKRDYVTRIHYEQAFNTLSTEIEYRANQTTVVMIQNELKVRRRRRRRKIYMVQCI